MPEWQSYSKLSKYNTVRVMRCQVVQQLAVTVWKVSENILRFTTQEIKIMKVTSIKKVKSLHVDKAVTATIVKIEKLDRISKLDGDLTLGGNNVS